VPLLQQLSNVVESGETERVNTDAESDSEKSEVELSQRRLEALYAPLKQITQKSKINTSISVYNSLNHHCFVKRIHT